MSATARFLLLLIAILIFVLAAILAFVLPPSVKHLFDVLGVISIGLGFFAVAHINGPPVV